MGNRANVAVQESEGKRVYLYTHWQGQELPETLRRALARNQRWDDPQYLARIIFCEMVKGNEASDTGFGITACVHDGESRVILVDCEKQEVSLEGKEGTGVGFSAFADLDEATWSSFKKKA